MQFPLEAEVHCSDGQCGKLTTVIVNPASEKVSYVVVKANQPHVEFIVPVGLVAETTAEKITLNCTADELRKMDPFTETEYIEMPMSYYGDPLGTYEYSYYGADIVPIDHELIPEGQIAVRRGMWVEATDGHLGAVDELIIDSGSQKITHFVMRKGHLWGEKEIAISISQIDRTEFETVYLKLAKAGIEAMPAVQIRRHYSKKEVDVISVEILLFTFDNTEKAEKAAAALKELTKNKEVEIRNAAIVIKDQNSETTFKEAEDVDSKRGAIFGAISGGLIGLLAGPVGAIVGASAGAATGSIAAGKIDLGFSNEYLQKLDEGLNPGSSALVTLVERESVDKVTNALSDFKGQLIKQAVTGEIAAQFTGKKEAKT